LLVFELMVEVRVQDLREVLHHLLQGNVNKVIVLALPVFQLEGTLIFEQKGREAQDVDDERDEGEQGVREDCYY